jgi:hypothetical protein
MSNIVRRAGLLASAVLLCVCSPVSAADEPDKSTLDQIKSALDELKKFKDAQPQTVNTNTLAIESWLLTSTAIDSTAQKIHDAVPEQDRIKQILVLAGDEALDANQAGMLKAEMESLSRRIRQASSLQCGTRGGPMIESVGGAVALATGIADLLKSQTEVTPISQSVSPKLLAAAVAGKFGGKAILPTAAIAAGNQGPLLRQFKDLVEQAEPAQEMRDQLAAVEKPSPCEKQKLARLTPAMASFDTFYARVTTAKDGAVPIVVADRLDRLLGEGALVLRVNTETAGGTLLKRTNLLTAFGAETAFISGGLVSSYQLTNPSDGTLVVAGVVTCRTALASLKRVQAGSWGSTPGGKYDAKAVCLP